MVYNNCALYMLLYKQRRGFYRCSKRVLNARSVFQEHHLVYALAIGLGTLRPDGSDSLIPTKRMPMGLLEYAVRIITVGHRLFAGSKVQMSGQNCI